MACTIAEEARTGSRAKMLTAVASPAVARTCDRCQAWGVVMAPAARAAACRHPTAAFPRRSRAGRPTPGMRCQLLLPAAAARPSSAPRQAAQELRRWRRPQRAAAAAAAAPAELQQLGGWRCGALTEPDGLAEREAARSAQDGGGGGGRRARAAAGVPQHSFGAI